ncbi:hypothetical protein MJ579_09045 [Klebsiella pneumoniae]|nr:hypothetical protein MJ579_09045 [Klebsiella pneumoniae]
MYGEKPTQAEYDEFKTTVTRHTMIRGSRSPVCSTRSVAIPTRWR